MMRLALLSAFIALPIAGCATRWVPCPDGLTVGGGIERGTVNGSDLAKLVQGGEADGVDSNYEGWRLDGSLHMKLGEEPRHCRTWGGEERD